MIYPSDSSYNSDRGTFKTGRIVCISHYGDMELLEECLKSLDKQECDIIIHDANASKFGFVRAYNCMMRNALTMFQENLDWIAILNNDTVVDENYIQAIDNKFNEDHKIGIVGSKIVSIEDRDTIQHAGTVQAVPNGVHKAGSVSNGDFEEDTKEKWVTGCSLAIRSDCLIDIGLMDSRYDLVCSDSDYCYTARSRGWEVWYAHKSVVYHHGGVSQNIDVDDMTRKRMTVDNLRFAEKWQHTRLWMELDREVV